MRFIHSSTPPPVTPRSLGSVLHLIQIFYEYNFYFFCNVVKSAFFLNKSTNIIFFKYRFWTVLHMLLIIGYLCINIKHYVLTLWNLMEIWWRKWKTDWLLLLCSIEMRYYCEYQDIIVYIIILLYNSSPPNEVWLSAEEKNYIKCRVTYSFLMK